MTEQLRALRVSEVERVTGLNRSTLWKLERRGEFPRRRKLLGGAVAWLSSEVDEWLRTRPLSQIGEKAAQELSQEASS